jgi:hypothetical protein
MRFFPTIITKGLILTVGVMVLGISVTRASLEILAQEINSDKIGNNPISFVINYGDGETEAGSYKLPEVATLPINPMYGLKRIRDYFWLLLSQGMNKNKLALLMADKKAEETRQLWQLNKNDEALEAGNEALDKLEYANQLVLASKGSSDELKQLAKQIYMAGFAYNEVFKLGNNAFDMDSQKYQQLINRNEEWNKTQKENRWKWNN